MAAHAQLLAVGDAAFEAARAIRAPLELLQVAVVSNLVVDLRAGQRGYLEPSADADGLDSRNGHQGLGQPPVQLLVP